MIFAKIPELVQDVIWTVVSIGAVAAVLAKAAHGTRAASENLKDWMTHELLDRLDRGGERFASIENKIDANAKYTRHHLGPNGDTPPLHQQVKDVAETVVDIDSRVHVLEIVHATTGVEPAVITQMLVERQSHGRRSTDPQQGDPQ